MKCPRCSADLIVIEYNDVELDCCSSCGGLWFDSGEIDVLTEKSGGRRAIFRPATNVREPRLRCPVCRSRMDKRYMGVENPVLVDVCPSCDGLWLDRGELEQVLERAGATDPIANHLSKTFGGSRTHETGHENADSSPSA